MLSHDPSALPFPLPFPPSHLFIISVASPFPPSHFSVAPPFPPPSLSTLLFLYRHHISVLLLHCLPLIVNVASPFLPSHLSVAPPIPPPSLSMSFFPSITSQRCSSPLIVNVASPFLPSHLVLLLHSLPPHCQCRFSLPSHLSVTSQCPSSFPPYHISSFNFLHFTFYPCRAPGTVVFPTTLDRGQR